MITHEETAPDAGALAVKNRRQGNVAALASWLFLLMCIFYVFPKPLPVQHIFLDDHWAAYLNFAFLAHKAFGSEIVFTYGPWGFLIHPRNIGGIYPWMVFGRAILATGCSFALATLGVRWIRRLELRVLWATAILIFVEPTYALMPLLCLLLWREPPAASVHDRLPLHVIAFSAGLAANTKFTCFIILALLLPPLMLRRHSRPLVLTAILSFVLFWFFAGQSLYGIPAFIATSLESASNYSSAMARDTHPALRLIGFVLCGFPAIVCGLAELRRPSFQSVALAGWLVLLEYIILGQAIIRCDIGHVALGLVATAFPVALALIACPHLWPEIPRGIFANRRLFVVVTFATTILCCLLIARDEEVLVPTYLPPIVQELHLIHDSLSSTSGTVPMPVPSMDASVAVLPDKLGEAFESGISLLNPPTLLSVMAWSPRLTALNSAFLESDRAPGLIYFAIEPFDHHYPALEDPLAWRSIFTHYQPAGTKNGFLLLSRKHQPARYVIKLISSGQFPLAESIRVPPNAGEVVWAQINVRRNWRWKILTALLNVQRLILDVETTKGDEKFFFEETNAQTGFLLSPYIDSIGSLERFYRAGTGTDSDRRVLRFRLHGSPLAMQCFSATMEVRLYSFAIQ